MWVCRQLKSAKNRPLKFSILRRTLGDGAYSGEPGAEGIACDLTRTDSQDGFLTILQQGGFDLILADYTLQLFDGISAFKIAQEICPEVPFIFVSGTPGEDLAIEALKLGATDYFLKMRFRESFSSSRIARIWADIIPERLSTSPLTPT